MHLNELYDTTEGKRSDKWSIYLDIYSEVFKGFKNKDVNLLEIGIQNGGSLEIWSRFFNNGKRFIGCDINEKCSSLSYDDKRISVIIGDANAISVKENIQKLFDGQINILIDDGSHTSGDIIKAFFNYFPLVSDDGIYVIEDLHCSYWEEFDGGLYNPHSSMTFLKLLADVINFEHWGLPGVTPEKLFSEFIDKYSLDVESSHILSNIYSISFYNSVCVIYKCRAGENAIGSRVFSGADEDVVDLSAVSKTSYALDQQANTWSTKPYMASDIINKFNEFPFIRRICKKVDCFNNENEKLTSFISGVNDEINKYEAENSSLKKEIIDYLALNQHLQDELDRIRANKFIRFILKLLPSSSK
ncbi:TPA: class I SAM-dependent methyltransferase [Aeromonas hydrophila]|nr:class I SAM-dependent methyltransferase [Aeromonas hydrophila]HAT2496544.1 class I SAM-dependent methyltransferase [Aeromonas hydrophila]HAT2511901.1 class I SAM-dependent methyltransferase [Aeromonas hydrophila]HAT2532393.1 class I SAM-dependent methyltransferase [Aeromonas hydrophila]